MNEETLDALLIDRALRALPPDTEALLAAYLGQNPDAADAVKHTHAAVGLVRSALKEEPPAPLPEYGAPRRFRRHTRRRRLQRAAGTAATLAIGVMVGRFLSDSPGTAQVHPTQTVAHTEPAPIVDHGIWTITPARLKNPPARAARWQWHSPVHRPVRMNQGDPS